MNRSLFQIIICLVEFNGLFIILQDIQITILKVIILRNLTLIPIIANFMVNNIQKKIIN